MSISSLRFFLGLDVVPEQGFPIGNRGWPFIRYVGALGCVHPHPPGSAKVMTGPWTTLVLDVVLYFMLFLTYFVGGGERGGVGGGGRRRGSSL